jgi:hypothetical protein
MHACLWIPEILIAIFAELTQVTESGAQPSFATLYHLTLTCRAFRELALDALWAHVQTPDMLIMCMPQDARSQPIKWTRGGRTILNIGYSAVSSMFFSLEHSSWYIDFSGFSDHWSAMIGLPFKSMRVACARSLSNNMTNINLVSCTIALRLLS